MTTSSLVPSSSQQLHCAMCNIIFQVKMQFMLALFAEAYGGDVIGAAVCVTFARIDKGICIFRRCDALRKFGEPFCRTRWPGPAAQRKPTLFFRSATDLFLICCNAFNSEARRGRFTCPSIFDMCHAIKQPTAFSP